MHRRLHANATYLNIKTPRRLQISIFFFTLSTPFSVEKSKAMGKKSSVLFIFIVAALIVSLSALKEEEPGEGGGDGSRPGFPPPSTFFVKKGERKTTVKTENGEVSAVRISDGIANGWYHIEFITLEPNSVFLPVLLQADMVLYVHTGSGKISWTDEDETKKVELKRGDIYRLRPGTFFYIESSLEMERQKLRIYALFANAETDLHEPETGPYTSIRKLVLGFDRVILEAAFGISGKPMEELMNSTDPGGIVHGFSTEKKNAVMVFEFMKGILGGGSYSSIFQSQSNKKNKKTKTYNIFSDDPDFQNCNGWSTVVSKKQLSALKDLDVSVFMVNLTKGSMMGPHWNPRATELGISLFGPGMVKVVCSSAAKQTGCKNMRFLVEEGDVFAVPRFHPMAQMAFDNHSFVFMGFSTSAKNNHPQYLAGKASVLRTLPRDIVGVSFGATNKTTDLVLDTQEQAIILDCTSCAEQELIIMKEEIEKAKEEAREKEEEARKKEEEKARKKKEEEEERKREEEEKRKEEEEAAREREEQERAKEEAERKKQEEEEARKEEAAREREEKEKEEEAEREKQQEEAERRAEEEQAREAARMAEEQAREAARRAEEEARQREAKERAEEQAREEEAEREKQHEAAERRAEEEARQREAKERAEEQAREEEAEREKQQEEMRRRAQEEEARKEGEAMQREARKREEAERQQQEEKQQQDEGDGGHPGKEWGRRILKT